MVDKINPSSQINYNVLNNISSSSQSSSASPSFKELITKAIEEVNKLQMEADKAMREFAQTGNIEKLPEVIVKIKEAELSFNLLLQVRNKIIDAYNDIQRMPL
jgi:flagellar hook-basal body complex protein FliE